MDMPIENLPLRPGREGQIELGANPVPKMDSQVVSLSLQTRAPVVAAVRLTQLVLFVAGIESPGSTDALSLHIGRHPHNGRAIGVDEEGGISGDQLVGASPALADLLNALVNGHHQDLQPEDVLKLQVKICAMLCTLHMVSTMPSLTSLL